MVATGCVGASLAGAVLVRLTVLRAGLGSLSCLTLLAAFAPLLASRLAIGASLTLTIVGGVPGMTARARLRKHILIPLRAVLLIPVGSTLVCGLFPRLILAAASVDLFALAGRL